MLIFKNVKDMIILRFVTFSVKKMENVFDQDAIKRLCMKKRVHVGIANAAK